MVTTELSKSFLGSGVKTCGVSVQNLLNPSWVLAQIPVNLCTVHQGFMLGYVKNRLNSSCVLV